MKVLIIMSLLLIAQSKTLRKKVNTVSVYVPEEIENDFPEEIENDIPEEIEGDDELFPEIRGEEVEDREVKIRAHESNSPQVGAMIGVEWEIRGIQVTESKRGRMPRSATNDGPRAYPSCVRSGRILWKCPGFGEVAADQTNVQSVTASGCAEYVSDPIPVREYNERFPTMAKAVSDQISKIPTVSRRINTVLSASELTPNLDPEKSTNCQSSSESSVKRGRPTKPVPQVTFSTSLAGLNRLDVASYLDDRKAKNTWQSCKDWCKAQTGVDTVDTRHADMTFKGFCTLVRTKICHF